MTIGARRRPGRQPKPEHERLRPFSTKITDGLYATLYRIAHARGLSVCELAREMLIVQASQMNGRANVNGGSKV